MHVLPVLVVYAIVDDLARTATMAAHEQLSNGSGSGSKVQDIM
jgi:hypothetical protein